MSDSKKLDEVIALLGKMVESRDEYYKIHNEEHDYLRVLIEEHKARKDAWKAIQMRVASGAIWAMIVALFSAVTFSFKTWMSGG